MKVALLTDFSDWNPVYCVTHIVQNQLTMLRRAGHDVTLVCAQQSKGIADSCVKRVIPNYTPADYHALEELSQEHRELSEQIAQILIEELASFDIAITHDWIFTSWKLPLAEALRIAAPQTQHCAFLHWIHSFPNQKYDWWSIHRYGPNHRIICPNQTDRLAVAAAFMGDPKHVRYIPNVIDLRTLRTQADFAPETWRFIDAHPELMSTTFTQVYPVTSDKMEQKGLRKLITVFRGLKDRGESICLVVANGNVSTHPNEDVKAYRRAAEREGLTDREIVFTSEFPEFVRGVPHDVLMSLAQCSSIFVFTSQAEMDPLGLAEVSLASGALPILNRCLPTMREGTPSGLYFHFGSWEDQRGTPIREDEYYSWMVDYIISRFRDEDALQRRNYYRTQRNMDVVYCKHYAPLFAESKTWVQH